jgi:hypothetical protein
MIYVRTPALPTTTTTVPVTTTTFQIVTTTTTRFVTTTTPAAARYILYEYQNTNVRWDPCSGPIRVKINPNSYVSATRLAEWETHLTSVTSEISSISGLDIVYAGITSTPLRNTHPNGRTSTDILFYVMPPGPLGDPGGTVLDAESWGQPGYWTVSDFTGQWGEIYSFDFAINANFVEDSSHWWKQHLMYYLGMALGLGELEENILTEIMGWYGWGSGSYGNPAWGPGDRIGLGLVGANNGCLY